MFRTLKTAFVFMWIGANQRWLKIRLILSFLLGIGIGLFGYLFPYYLSILVKAINEKNQPALLFAFYALILSTAGLWFVKFIWRFFCERITYDIPLRIKQFYYRKLFDKSYQWHLNNSVGYFTVALEQVYQNLQNWLWKMPFEYISSIIIYLLFLSYTLTVSPVLFGYFCICFFVMLILLRVLYNRSLSYIANVTNANVKFGKTFIDFLYNIRSVKKMNLFTFTNNQITQKRMATEEINERRMRYNAILWGIMECLISALFLLPVGYYISVFLKTGQDVEIIVMIVAIQPKMEQLGRLVLHFMNEVARAQAEYALLAQHLKQSKETSYPKTTVSDWETITFDHTLFQFVKENTVFSHYVADFTIHRGDHIAVTGKSGEGKSTFLNLLTGQFPLIDGKITINNVAYSQLDTSFFSEKMAYISQDIELFDMTLYDNIVLGQEISDEEVQKIIDGCCLNELVERMGGNWHTDIGEKGIKVSAGEKQRINLARGLLLKRDILIIDEITANLDPITTCKNWEFIFTAYGEKTIISVSHEPEMIKHVGRNLYFKHGVGTEIDVIKEII